MSESKVYTVADIASECEVLKDSITRFIAYCNKTGAYSLPKGVRGFRNRYEFTKEEKDTIVNAFNNRKYGEMAEFNKSYWWGKKFREKGENKDETDISGMPKE